MNPETSPLVSIIVVTYNSSKYVIETLESAKKQTYRNIELIITDDCSKDNTVALCEDWIVSNSTYFKDCTLVRVKKNTGITPNCNRGLSAAKGQWLKLIAGDDMLMQDCIATNIDFAANSSDSFFFSMLNYTVSNPQMDNAFKNGLRLFNSGSNQHKILLKGNCLPAASAFIKRDTLLALDGFDEKYPMLEDYPLWLKASKHHRLVFKPEVTATYRIHSESTSGNTLDSKRQDVYYTNFLYQKSWFMFQRDFVLGEQAKHLLVYSFYTGLIDFAKFQVAKACDNKKTLWGTVAYSFLTILSPNYYRALLKKML